MSISLARRPLTRFCIDQPSNRPRHARISAFENHKLLDARRCIVISQTRKRALRLMSN